MKLIERNICNLESQYKNKKTKLRLQVLLNKYFLGFLCFDNEEYLRKAFNVCLEYLNINKSDLDILLAIFFFSIQIKDKSRIEFLNNAIGKYKKYLKNNDIKKYNFYLFLQALIKKDKESELGVLKYIKLLEGIKAKNYSEEIDLYILYLKLEIDTLDRTSFANIKNVRINNSWRNILYYKLFEKNAKFISCDREDFKRYIKWGIYNGINIEKSISRYEINIDINAREFNFNKRLYKEYNFDFILFKICEAYLNENIHNKYNYFFFKEAINRQLLIPNLNDNYIKACFENNFTDIGLYPIKKFLRNDKIDINILPFIYYIILSDKKYIDLVYHNKENILKYGLFFLERNMKGKYFFSIYKFMLEFLPDKSIEEKKILNILYKYNFSYTLYIEDENVKYILVKDYLIDGVKEYSVVNKVCNIQVSSNRFEYYAFYEDRKEIILTDIKISKNIEGTNGKYFYRFYKNGYRDNYVLINIARYYLEVKNVDEEGLMILEQVINMKRLSSDFKMRILLLLGNLSFDNKNYKLASAYYKKVGENYISNKNINNILKSYILCREYENCLDIIKKHRTLIEDASLYYAIKTISQEPMFYKKLANFAYQLTLNYTIDEILLNIVVKTYRGSLNEFIELRKVLAKNNIYIKEIEEKILYLTVYTHNLNLESELIFIKMYKEDIENENIEYFLNYCIYEAINENYKFSDEFVYILEYIFNEINHHLIGYALAHIYINQDYNLDAKYSIIERVVSNMEEDSINFKIFENNKDKFIKLTYLYKNKPFIYNASFDSEVFLFYKNMNETEFNRIKMKYFKFGIHIATLPVFYTEDIEYYFVENVNQGENIVSRKYFTTNSKNMIFDNEDEYFKINNAYIYTYDGKYNQAHKAIENLISKEYNLKGKLL